MGNQTHETPSRSPAPLVAPVPPEEAGRNVTRIPYVRRQKGKTMDTTDVIPVLLIFLLFVQLAHLLGYKRGYRQAVKDMDTALDVEIYPDDCAGNPADKPLVYKEKHYRVRCDAGKNG